MVMSGGFWVDAVRYQKIFGLYIVERRKVEWVGPEWIWWFWWVGVGETTRE